MIHHEGGPDKQSAKNNVNEVKKFPYESFQQLWLRLGITREKYSLLSGAEVNKLIKGSQ